MNRRGFLGAVLGLVEAPKTLLAKKPLPKVLYSDSDSIILDRPIDFFARSNLPHLFFTPERVVMKFRANSLYGKLGGCS